MGFKKYNLTDTELQALANLAKQEQGTIDGACAELSLMANRFEKQTKYKTLYEYVRNAGWFARAAYYMDNGDASATYKRYAKYVLCHGLRTLPADVDEHDCFSDIAFITTGSIRNRSDYKRGETKVYNTYGSGYTFYCFPDKSSDPFGSTKAGKAPEGSLPALIEKERELANIPYAETGTNHQVFSSIVNNAGLAGYQDQAWCCTYQFAMEILEFGVGKALKHWHMTRDTYCGYACFETYDAFAKVGKVGKIPELGALVIFTHSHAGRVLSIDTDTKTFACGEGNTSNAQYDRSGDSCAIKTYTWDDPRIKGFCYIDYVEEMGGKDTVEGYQTTFEILHIGMNGPDVETLQDMLSAKGYTGKDGKPLELDGEFGENTDYALRCYQRDHGLDPDGWAGKLTWANLFGRVA